MEFVWRRHNWRVDFDAGYQGQLHAKRINDISVPMIISVEQDIC